MKSLSTIQLDDVVTMIFDLLNLDGDENWEVVEEAVSAALDHIYQEVDDNGSN